MALLRVPAGLVNGRTLDKAVETAKSLECKAFESSRNARLESLDKRYAKAYMEGFQMRKIRENVEKSIRGNPFFDMGQETV